MDSKEFIVTCFWKCSLSCDLATTRYTWDTGLRDNANFDIRSCLHDQGWGEEWIVQNSLVRDSMEYGETAPRQSNCIRETVHRCKP